MLETNPNRTCGCCGYDIPPGLEARRNLSTPGSTDPFCLRCERQSLETDAYAAEAILTTVEAAVSAALSYASDADVIATVVRVISESRDRHETLESIGNQLLVNRNRQKATGS